jgi:hypothetical protein
MYMKRFTVILLLLVLAAPAWSAVNKKVTVQQLKDLLTSLEVEKKSDAAVAAELKQLELTEELTPSAMQSLAAYIAGPLSTEQIYVLEARSAVLAPPATDLPATAPLDAAAQQALLAKASDYVAKTYSQLPHLTATRMTARFQDGVAAVHTFTGMNHGLGEDSDPLWQTSSLDVRLVNTRTTAVESVNGIEKPAGKDTTQWGPNNMTASVGTPLALSTILQEAVASGNPKWLRWELVNGKQTAVFAFNVEKKKTKFAVSYCCFPDTDTAGVMSTGGGVGPSAGNGGTGTLQTISEWKPFKANTGYHGELFIDPDLGVVIRTITQADFKPTDFVHSEAIRTDYAPMSIGGKTLIVRIRSFTLAEVVPNGDSFAATYAVRRSFITQNYKDYALVAK